MTETVNGVEWVIYLFAEVIPYLLWEAGRTLAEFTRTSPWGTALGILVAGGRRSGFRPPPGMLSLLG